MRAIIIVNTLVTVIPCCKTEFNISSNLDVFFDLHVFQALLENSNDCCERIKRMNETCGNSTLCDPGMFLFFFFFFFVGMFLK